ncbi:MAG TPA: hypothetical protein VNM37_08975, partial [Candidatus Dormibacteraeota bacterium]|nr:hypothetical protein [Candidatus Dormibacteraeota bacterium]
NTDNNSTGYNGAPAVGSEFLNQSSSFFQEKNGGFNDGVAPLNMQFLVAPTTPAVTFPADYEFRLSRAATYGGGGLIFPTNVLSFVWVGQTTGFVAKNTAPSGGGTISYTNAVPTVVPSLPLGQIAVYSVPGGNVALVWDQPGTLQFSSALENNSWTNLPAATSPYIVPASGQQFFRLVK